MPRIEYRVSRRKGQGLLIFYRVLLVLALALVLVILGGTLYALALRPSGKVGGGVLTSPRIPASGSPALPVGAPNSDTGIFTGLGRLRCPAAGLGTVILQAVFPYSPGDRPFSEELVSRIREFRQITVDYFAALPAEELRRKDETAIKAELLARYNAVLRLGQIETLYFNDFMIIE
jgi:hypothetical protein